MQKSRYFDQQRRTQASRGQTIIEILIATGVVALVMTAVVALISVSVRNAARAKAKGLATKYSQEAIEYFRAQRTVLGWETFWATIGGQTGQTRSTSACLASLPYSDTAGLQTVIGTECRPVDFVDTRKLYQRSAVITTAPVGGTDTVTVNVTVTWQDGNRRNVSSASAQMQKPK